MNHVSELRLPIPHEFSYLDHPPRTEDHISTSGHAGALTVDSSDSSVHDVVSSTTASVHDVVTTAVAQEREGWAWAWPRLALLGMAGVCGTNFPILHVVSQTMPPSDVAFLRFAAAFLPFVPYVVSRVASKPLWEDETFLPGLEIGAWCALGYITQGIGLSMTAPAKGAFICALFMVVTPLANGLMGNRIPPQAWAAVAISLVGTATLEGLIGGGAGDGLAAALAEVNTGDLWCFGGALGFGLMFARMEKHMEELEDAALPLTAWQVLALFVSMAAWCGGDFLARGGSGAGEWLASVQAALDTEPILAPSLLWMGLVTSALVLWGETVVLEMVPSTEAGVLFSSEPVWALAIAALVLHDPITTNELLGGAAIVLACLTLQIQLPGASGSDVEDHGA